MELLTNDTPEPRTHVTVRVLSGPAVVPPTRLGVGAHVIGRSPTGTVVLDDPDAEPHHLLVEVGGEVGVENVVVTALAGRVAIQVDGRPLSLGVGRALDPGPTTIRIGRTQLELEVRDGPSGDGPSGDGEVMAGTTVVRTTRRAPAPVRMEVPASPIPGPPSISPPSAALLAASASSLAVGGVMAVVLGHLIFLVFALTGAAVSATTWAVGRFRAARAHRDHRRALDDHVDHQRRAHGAARDRARERMLAVHPDVGDLLMRSGTERTWERRFAHGDAFTVVLGRGEVHVPVVVTGTEGPSGPVTEPLTDVPVTADLAGADGANRVITVHGHGADAVVRSMLVQLAITTGPADVSVRCLATGPAWDACARLPHAHADPADTDLADTDLADTGDDATSHRIVVVTADPVSLTVRSCAVRTWLDRRRGVTVLVAAGPEDPVPAISTSVLRIGAGGVDTWEPDAGPDHEAFTATRLRSAGLSPATAAAVVTRLAPLVDPEQIDEVGSGLPDRCSLAGLVPLDVEHTTAAWHHGGRDPGVRGVLGQGIEGIVEIDLVTDGPHGLVAGTTGSGKSELLRTLVVSLAARTSPEHLHFVLVDYKGGATFDACTELPHTATVVTDLDGGAAERALAGLEAELRRRERLLRAAGTADLTAYRAMPETPALARLVVVIDEFAALVSEVPGFVPALVGLAQRGRSLGMHLLLATQRPAGVVDDAIRANTDLRLALRLQDAADARDVVGDASAAAFPRTAPGRTVLVAGPDRRVVFQAASCTGDTGELIGIVGIVAEAARRLGLESAAAPWLPGPDELGEPTVRELPALLGDPDHAADAVGIVDVPDEQRRRPLRWDRTGNLVMIGSLGSGTTAALIAVATRAVDATDRVVHIGAIDARGDRGLGPLDRHARCVGVVGLHETERMWRVLARLVDEIDRRRARVGVRTDPPVDAHEVLVVDGLGVLRRSLDTPAQAESAALLDRVLVEGPAVGVFTVAALEPGPGVAAVIGRFTHRWVFHLDDPADGPGLGVRAGSVPSRRPGRMTEVASGCAGLVVGGIEPTECAPDAGRSVTRIRTLPRRIDELELQVAADRSDHRIGDTAALAIGLRHRDLGVARLELAPGEHLLVVGAPRSGRSNALVTLASAWSREHPHGSVTVVSGRGIPDRPLRRLINASTAVAADLVDALDALDALDVVDDGAPHLVVVDHAERVEDPTGRMSSAIAEANPAITVLAAGRADALRTFHGHWTGMVRRSRLGLVLTGGSELDGEAFGVMLPRRLPIPARRGLAWSIGPHGHELAQLAIRTTDAVDDAGFIRADRAPLVPTGPR